MTQLNEQPMTKAQEIQIARKALKPNPFVTANLFTAENVTVMTSESRIAHQTYFEELMLAAAENRDYDSLEVLKKAVQVIKTSFLVADVPRGTFQTAHLEKAPEPEPPQEPLAPAAPVEPAPPAEEGLAGAEATAGSQDAEKEEQLRKTMAVLDKHGIQPDMLPGADDNDLLQINGIGQRRLALIRSVYPKANA